MNLAILKILVPSTCWYLLRFLRYSISQYTVYKPKYIVRFLLQSENVDNLHMESLYADFKFCWIQAIHKMKIKDGRQRFWYSNFWHLITFLWNYLCFSGILSHEIILRLYSLPVVEKVQNVLLKLKYQLCNKCSVASISLEFKIVVKVKILIWRYHA